MSFCDVFVIPFVNHKYRNSVIYQHVQDLAQNIAVASALQGFYFKFRAHRVPGADGHGMEDAQETGGANISISGHSVNVKNKCASKITEKMPQSKSCDDLSDLARETDQGVGY